jgi:hypothetical protein
MLFLTLQTIFASGVMFLIVGLFGDAHDQPPTDLSDATELFDTDR